MDTPPDRYFPSRYDRHRINKAAARLRLAAAKMGVASIEATEATQRLNIAMRRAMEAAELGAVKEVHNLALARRARN